MLIFPSKHALNRCTSSLVRQVALCSRLTQSKRRSALMRMLAGRTSSESNTHPQEFSICHFFFKNLILFYINVLLSISETIVFSWGLVNFPSDPTSSTAQRQNVPFNSFLHFFLHPSSALNAPAFRDSQQRHISCTLFCSTCCIPTAFSCVLPFYRYIAAFASSLPTLPLHVINNINSLLRIQ